MTLGGTESMRCCLTCFWTPCCVFVDYLTHGLPPWDSSLVPAAEIETQPWVLDSGMCAAFALLSQ